MNYLKKIEKNFNKSANTYRKYARLQATVGDYLLNKLLLFNNQFNHIIDLGCGDGNITKKLFATTKSHSFEAIDIADLHVANLKKSVYFHVYKHDFNQPLNQSFDLIFANMSLQWALDFSKTMLNISNSLQHHGYIAMTLPLKNTLTELKHFFGINYFNTQEAILKTLESNQLHVLWTEKILLQETFPDIIAALRSIKHIGANTVFQSKNHLRGKNFLAHIDIKNLTYEIGYFIAQKK